MPDGFAARDAAGNTVTVAADDIAGILYQLNKLCFGAADAVTQVSPVAPLPTAAQLAGGYVDENGVRRTIQRAVLNLGAAVTDQVIVAAVASQIVRVLFLAALAGPTATDLRFTSKGAGAGTAISPVLQNGANGGEVLGPNGLGWLQTNAGEALAATSGAGASTGILVGYVQF